MPWVKILLSVAALFLFLFLFLFFRKKLFQREVKKSLNYQLFLIAVPREVSAAPESGGSQKTFKDFVAVFEQALESLSKYKKEFIFEIAAPNGSPEICFYAACWKKDTQFFEKTFASLFPYARIEPTEDYTIFSPRSQSAGLRFAYSEPFVLPIKNFQAFEEDPLSMVVNAFTKTVPQEEGAALQIVLKPYGGGMKKQFTGIKKALNEGKSLDEAMAKPSAVAKSALKKESTEEKIKPRIDENLIKLVDEKSQYPLFYANLRLLASASTTARAEEILSHLEASFNALSNPMGNSLTARPSRSQRQIKKIVYDWSFRIFRKKEAVLLNSMEAATLFHFPHPFLENSRVKWLGARNAPAPLHLPTTGVALGRNVFQMEEREVRILDEDRRRHVYIIGQTGTGKTSLMRNMFRQDVLAGKGVCYIDPHGDTAEYLMGLVPESRYADVIYFNPGDFERSFGLNMLEWDRRYPFQKSFVTNELLEILDKLYDLKTVGGPVFEQYFRNALLLLLDDAEKTHTLNDVPRILVNPDFRKDLLAKTPNPMVREFWEKEAEKAGGELALANVAPYINSKLNPFLANDLVRPIISQPQSSVDFRQAMDEQKILIINLSKGLLGDINSYLLGMIVVGKLMMAAFSRVDVPEEQRKDFYLYIDEFQNVATETIATIFSEARKYRLDLTVANQFLGQLKEPILKSVFGNVGTIAAFRVGNEDAEFLAKYFAPVFNTYDLINLDNFNAYIKLAMQGQVSRAFNFKTDRPVDSDPQKLEFLKKLSADRYARPRQEIEEEIKKGYQN